MKNKVLFFCSFQLSEELLDKWLSYPETQHIPLSQHMLGFALKFVTRMVLGSTFEDEQEVIRFQKIHGTVSRRKHLKQFFNQAKQLNADFTSEEGVCVRVCIHTCMPMNVIVSSSYIFRLIFETVFLPKP